MQCRQIERQACSGMPVLQIAHSPPLPPPAPFEDATCAHLQAFAALICVRTAYWLCFVGLETAQQDDQAGEAGGSQDETVRKLHPMCALQCVQRIAHVAWNRRRAELFTHLQCLPQHCMNVHFHLFMALKACFLQS